MTFKAIISQTFLFWAMSSAVQAQDSETKVFTQSEAFHYCDELFQLSQNQHEDGLRRDIGIESYFFDHTTIDQLDRLRGQLKTDHLTEPHPEIRIMSKTKTVNEQRILIFGGGSIQVPLIQTELEYFYCHYDEATNAILEIGVLHKGSSNRFERFDVSLGLLKQLPGPARGQR